MVYDDYVIALPLRGFHSAHNHMVCPHMEYIGYLPYVQLATRSIFVFLPIELGRITCLCEFFIGFVRVIRMETGDHATGDIND